jgi:hypothetical protein
MAAEKQEGEQQQEQEGKSKTGEVKDSTTLPSDEAIVAEGSK